MNVTVSSSGYFIKNSTERQREYTNSLHIYHPRFRFHIGKLCPEMLELDLKVDNVTKCLP